MVKQIDELTPDHIGIRLWEASKLWETQFTAGMIAAGYPWFGEAKASVLPYISPQGTKQVEIVRRMQISKQAVQQLILELEAEGIITRLPDPDDGRGRIVAHTEAGITMRRAAVQVKAEVENSLRAKLGDTQFSTLFEALGAIVQAESPPAKTD